MNILLVNHYAGHPNLGMEFRPFYMAREWQKQGHSVEILACDQSHVRQRQPKLRRWFQRNTLDDVQYTWIRSTKYSGNGVARVINIFGFLIRAYFYGRFKIESEPDVVIASSTYPLDIYVCEKIAKRFGAQLIFEVHDLWPLSPIEIGGIPPGHPFMRLLQRAEDHAYQCADQVVSILPCTLEHMQKRGLAPEKFHSIPNGFPMEEWSASGPLPQEHQKLLDSLKKKGAFLLAYTGAHGIANDLDSLLDASAELPTDIHVILVGDGPEKKRLREKAQKGGVTHVHFLPPVEKDLVPALLNQVDAVYIGLVSQPLFRFGVSPNKLIDYMMAAKPIVYAIDSGNHPVIEAGCGIEVKPGEPKKIAAGILELYEKDSELRKSMGKNGRAYAIKNHSYDKLAARFLGVMSC